MLFTHDTEVSLVETAALVNTLTADDGDALATPDDFEDFLRRNPYSGEIRRTPGGARIRTGAPPPPARAVVGEGPRRGRRAGQRDPGRGGCTPLPGQARRVGLAPARHPARCAAGRSDRRRGRDVLPRPDPGRRPGPADGSAPPTTARMSSSTCRAIVPSGTATPATAATAPTSPPIAHASGPSEPSHASRRARRRARARVGALPGAAVRGDERPAAGGRPAGAGSRRDLAVRRANRHRALRPTYAAGRRRSSPTGSISATARRSGSARCASSWPGTTGAGTTSSRSGPDRPHHRLVGRLRARLPRRVRRR